MIIFYGGLRDCIRGIAIETDNGLIKKCGSVNEKKWKKKVLNPNPKQSNQRFMIKGLFGNCADTLDTIGFRFSPILNDNCDDSNENESKSNEMNDEKYVELS